MGWQRPCEKCQNEERAKDEYPCAYCTIRGLDYFAPKAEYEKENMKRRMNDG